MTPDDQLLPRVLPVDAPWPLWRAEGALPEPALAGLDALFDAELAWARHESFYRCDLAVVTERVPAALRRGLAARVRAVTGLPLEHDLTVTAQRMRPGDHALPHTDRPLLGYEAVRLVLQLGGAGDPAEGGVFSAHHDPDGLRTAWARAPRRGEAVIFPLTPRSHHAVGPTRVERRTVVWHLRHLGNDGAVADAVQGWLRGLRFDRLDPAVAAVAADVEARVDDDTSHLAGCVAWVLAAWGRPSDEQVEGYLRAAAAAPLDDDPWPIALARHVAQLAERGFDLDAWARLAARPPPAASGPARDAWETLVGRARAA